MSKIDLERTPSGTSDKFVRSKSKEDDEDFTTWEGMKKIGE
jgi:hypothetical protein